MFSLLVFMFCFFIGSLVMFFYSLKKRESQFKSLSEENAQLRVLLRAMESRLDNMEKYMALCAGFKKPSLSDESEPCPPESQENSTPDPLLHLSFEDPNKNRDAGLDILLDSPETENKK